MQKTFPGYCKEQDKRYFIAIDYHNVSTTTQTQYIRGLYDCDYRKSHGCKETHCSIFADAPETI